MSTLHEEPKLISLIREAAQRALRDAARALDSGESEANALIAAASELQATMAKLERSLMNEQPQPQPKRVSFAALENAKQMERGKDQLVNGSRAYAA